MRVRGRRRRNQPRCQAIRSFYGGRCERHEARSPVGYDAGRMARMIHVTTSTNPAGDPGFLDFAEFFVRYAAYTSFIWVPFVFIAYALGRRRFSLWFFLALAAAEGVAVLVAIWIHQGGWWPSIMNL